MEKTIQGWVGTVEELRKWLDQFKDTDIITFYGGEDGGGEFMVVLVNDNEVLYW